MIASRTVRLADGRTLAFEVAGDPSGLPVFLAHGFPGSRLEAHVVGDAAAAAGVRLVCPDRPGFGGSDPQPGRVLADWPADVAELAGHLGLGRFAVVGFSAGGPYALACAALLGERVSACAIVSSPGPLHRPGSTNGMAAVNRILFGAGRRVPLLAGLVVRLIARFARAEQAVVGRRMAQGMAPSDRRLLSQPPIGAAYGAAVREAFRQGSTGPILEAALLVRPWAFSVDQISAPTSVWHGLDDRNVPARFASEIGALIPQAEVQRIEGAGHLLFFERAELVFERVRKIAASS
ncbi:MAG TPA: alpha/beta hydrolase [Candidatus Sulfomarinibacteraceae bacterium]|nr:alpha/beta hydrolase [Candidatus Sulfomarinibacteraceae bacterium]